MGKVCPKSADDSVNVPALTPKKLIAYKRGMALKKAAALAAFQQVYNIICISDSCFGLRGVQDSINRQGSVKTFYKLQVNNSSFQ